MKKSLLAIAVTASLLAPIVSMAEPHVYGNIHLTVQAVDNQGSTSPANNKADLKSNTSAIGVKGSEDLSNGLKAIYKVEFDVNVTDGGALKGRDQFVGIKSNMGIIKAGTMSSNYKQTGAKVDPLYRTPLEGRGSVLGTQSDLHSGKGINRGRETNTVQYISPRFEGVRLVANTTLSANNDESTGIGLRWSNKHIFAYVDYIKSQTGATADVVGTGSATNPQFAKGAVITTNCNAATSCSVEAATKIGGKYHTDKFSVAIQYENADKRTGANYLFTSGTYTINSSNIMAITYGKVNAKIAGTDYTGVAIAYIHVLSKKFNVYVGYGKRSSDTPSKEAKVWALGVRKRF